MKATVEAPTAKPTNGIMGATIKRINKNTINTFSYNEKATWCCFKHHTRTCSDKSVVVKKGTCISYTKIKQPHSKK